MTSINIGISFHIEKYTSFPDPPEVLYRKIKTTMSYCGVCQSNKEHNNVRNPSSYRHTRGSYIMTANKMCAGKVKTAIM